VDHGRNGLIAASGDAAGLSAQIIDIIENNEKRTRLGYAGQADSDRFAGPKIAAQWHDFINSFLK
jgi:glycosyltransferase involved in cell wall biosynthesis